MTRKLAATARYFAYGSNLDAADLRRWCAARGAVAPRLDDPLPALLPDRRLAFTHRSTTRGGGVLDVPEAIGCAVPGILFLTDAAGLATLDGKESDGHVYRRLECEVLAGDGSAVRAFTYEVAPEGRGPHVPPPPAYLEAVRRGYAAHGLDAADLRRAASGEPVEGPVHRLFVYGTLMRGESRGAMLASHGTSFIGAGTAAGTILDLGDHPGMVPGRTDRRVHGELHRLGERAALFGELDVVEGFRGFGVPGSTYRRTILSVLDESGGFAPAWTYVYEGPAGAGPVLESGSWRRKNVAPR